MIDNNKFFIFMNEGMGDMFVSLNSFLYLREKSELSLTKVIIDLPPHLTGGLNYSEIYNLKTVYDFTDLFNIENTIENQNIDTIHLNNDNGTDFKNTLKDFGRVTGKQIMPKPMYIKSKQTCSDGDYIALNFYEYDFYIREGFGNYVNYNEIDHHKFLHTSMVEKYIQYLKSKNLKFKWLLHKDSDLRTYRGVASKETSKELIKRNSSIIANSKFFVSSEGFWTHIAQSINKKTIGFSVNINVVNEFNDSRCVIPSTTVEEIIECTEQMI